MSQARASSGWLQVREVGSVLGIRIVLYVATAFGRAPMRGLLRVIVLYYALVHGAARAASRAYLQRIGRPSGFLGVYAHLLRFAQCAADRPFLIAGRCEAFEIVTHGAEHLAALCRQRRGALLLGAHLGSFEALAAQAGQERLVVNVVGYFRNAQRINRVLEQLGSQVHTRLLEPGSGIEFALRLRACIERGEFVAMLGDRQVDGKSTAVEFLGGRAAFPTGPFALAAALGCPVLLTFGLHFPPRRYELHCEPFAERVLLPRAQREQALHAHVQRFAARLEHYCRRAPDNWFNFYDFWNEGGR
jgi:predicted LPLAT superfamily acyltransferase